MMTPRMDWMGNEERGDDGVAANCGGASHDATCRPEACVLSHLTPCGIYRRN